jgi:hypothetical protein
MAGTDIKTTAWRVLGKIFPADDQAALSAAINENSASHEAPAGTPPGRGSVTSCMRLLASVQPSPWPSCRTEGVRPVRCWRA